MLLGSEVVNGYKFKYYLKCKYKLYSFILSPWGVCSRISCDNTDYSFHSLPFKLNHGTFGVYLSIYYSLTPSLL